MALLFCFLKKLGDHERDICDLIYGMSRDFKTRWDKFETTFVETVSLTKFRTTINCWIYKQYFMFAIYYVYTKHQDTYFVYKDGAGFWHISYDGCLSYYQNISHRKSSIPPLEDWLPVNPYSHNILKYFKLTMEEIEKT
jgi:hypothetical protein